MDIQYITNIWACIAYLTSYICKPERTMSELMKKACKEAHEKGVREKLYNTGSIFLKAREISEHEAISRVLSLKLRQSNVDVLFIQTDPKDNRIRILKSKKKLEKLDDDDQDIYENSIHDYYASRPDNMENICLAEFAANYTRRSQSQYQEESTKNIKRSDSLSIILKNDLGKMNKRSYPFVIRYHFVSKDKDSEMYYHRLLLLYYPWRKEESLKQNDTYESKFCSVKDIIIPIIKLYEPYCDDVENILEGFDPDDVGPEIWDEIAAETQQEVIQESNVSKDTTYSFIDPDNLEADIPAVPQQKRQQSKALYSIATIHRMADIDFYKMVQSLNQKQRPLFDFIYNWAVQTRTSELLNSDKPAPFSIFLSGGAGVGKSHTVNTIFQGVVRALRAPGQDPDKPTVLMTASTGKAATNVNGITVHSAFALPVKQQGCQFLYRKPSAERLNTMRSNYVNLKLIIIDEISMLGGKNLTHLSLVLQDIFEDHTSDFANVSILAVGDLLQLNPVGDIPVYQQSFKGYQALAPSVWRKNFKLYELTDIVRQKGDPDFADILSRVRTGTDTMTDDDIMKLKELEKTPTENFPEDTIHLYFTNAQVGNYNEIRLAKLNIPKITIHAKDSKKDLHTNAAPVQIRENNIYKTGGLPQSMTICKGARWMLTKNIDVSDHLVNGATGIIQHIDIDPNNPLDGTLYIKFDNDDVGREAKTSSPPSLKNAVGIKAVIVKFSLSAQCNVPVERKMFPGILAYAITCHKAQGSTYDFMVADLTLPPQMKSVQPGHVYTMLSRATSRSAIKLIDFDQNKISVNSSALKEMKRMNQESLLELQHTLNQLNKDYLSIGHINIRSLNLHGIDLQADKLLHNISILCVTETHMSFPTERHYIAGYNLFHKCTPHGLAIYVKTELHISQLQLNTDTIEIMGIIIPEIANIILVYKPPQMPPSSFIRCLSDEIDYINDTNRLPLVIVGDFNMDLTKHSFDLFIRKHELIQLVNKPTHILGGTLDLIFTTFSRDKIVTADPHPLPYTDHHLVWAAIK